MKPASSTSSSSSAVDQVHLPEVRLRGSRATRERCCTVTPACASPSTPRPASRRTISVVRLENRCSPSRATATTTRRPPSSGRAASASRRGPRSDGPAAAALPSPKPAPPAVCGRWGGPRRAPRSPPRASPGCPTSSRFFFFCTLLAAVGGAGDRAHAGHLRHAALGDGLHHLRRLLEAVDELVHVGDRHARAAGDAQRGASRSGASGCGRSAGVIDWMIASVRTISRSSKFSSCSRMLPGAGQHPDHLLQRAHVARAAASA